MFGKCDKAGCEKQNYDMQAVHFVGDVTARLCTEHANALVGAISATPEFGAFDEATIRLRTLIQKGDEYSAAQASNALRPLTSEVRDLILAWINEPAAV